MPEKSRDNKISFHVNLHPFFISRFQIDGLNVIFNDFSKKNGLHTLNHTSVT